MHQDYVAGRGRILDDLERDAIDLFDTFVKPGNPRCRISRGAQIAEVRVPWTMMRAPAWGLHTSASVDPSQLFVVSIGVDKGIDFDLWIDDVGFYK